MAYSNFTLKWDNAPANYGALFYVSEVISDFDFAVGTLPLSVVVRTHKIQCSIKVSLIYLRQCRIFWICILLSKPQHL